MKETITIIKCDRCGNPIEDKEVFFHGHLGQFERGDEIHLCKSCTPLVNKFISGRLLEKCKCCRTCVHSSIAETITDSHITTTCICDKGQIGEQRVMLMKKGYCDIWEMKQ